MGFNIAGVATNCNKQNDVQPLEHAFDCKLELHKEITFEEAMKNWGKSGYLNIYWGEKGALVFSDFEQVGAPITMEKHTCFTFLLSETSMTFALSYAEGENILRQIIESEDTIVEEEGLPLPAEENESDLSEVIWKTISDTIGENIWDIDFETKAYQYKIRPKSEKIDFNQLSPTEQKKAIKSNITTVSISTLIVMAIGIWGLTWSNTAGTVITIVASILVVWNIYNLISWVIRIYKMPSDE